jgi:hypothetical protein
MGEVLTRMQQRPRDLGGAVPLILALLIAAAFVGILLHGIDFPLGTHADEASKVNAILKHRNNYAHPLLMLQLVRAANAFAGLTDPQALVELGRAFAVMAGGLAVVASFLLAREVLPIPAALAATLAVAVVPVVTVHARYFKEDIFALPFLLLALVALIDTLKSPTKARGALLGAAIGLAAAAKYIAAIALPFAIVFLLLNPSETVDRRARRRLAGLVAVIAIAVFALIQLPALWEVSRFRSALGFNFSHAGQGHDVRVPVGFFHLRQSLLPGLGLPLLALGILGLAAPWLAPSERRQPLCVIAGFALLWYVAHELSPLKPFPGYVRYVLPLAPLLIILGAAFVYELLQRRFGAMASGMTAAILVLAAAIPALCSSLHINGPAGADPRATVSAAVLSTDPRAAFDHYTRFAGPGGQTPAQPRPTASTADIFVTSSFAYDRFAQFGASSAQPEPTHAKAAYYAALFKLPYLEVTSDRPSYAFFNPVLRIVALDGDRDRLAPIAAALQRDAPGLTIQFVNAEP